MKHLAFKVWVCAFVYALLAGLAIQLVVLPLVFPQLHAGHGLLAGRDWVGFHEQAVVMADKIARGGWNEFLLRPDGDNAITGVASFFYVVFSPEPWSLLPLSAAVFATGGVALFSMLRYLKLDCHDAIIATLPYLFFPSALLQYSQIHKDVFCTTGVLVILWSWVSLLRRERQARQIVPLLAISALATIVLSMFRPYFMFPFLGLGALLLVWHTASACSQLIGLLAAKISLHSSPKLRFTLASTGILIVLNAFVYVMSISLVDVRLRPFSAEDIHGGWPVPTVVWQSNAEVRSADALRILSPNAFAENAGRGAVRSEAERIERAKLEAAIIKGIEDCRPVVILRQDAFFENLVNRAFLKIAVARAGFTSSGGTTAASNIDKGIDFCKNEDLIRYVPRAMQIALFAPFPSSWLAVEKRNSSSIEIYISAVEMFYCYIAYAGLIYWLFNYRRWSLSLAIPIVFALGLTLLLGLTVANVGTLYRMRFPFAMIFVSIGMAGILQVVKIKPRWMQSID